MSAAVKISVLTPLVSSADNFDKQFVPRFRQTEWPDLDPNFLTLKVFLKEFLEKAISEKNQQTTNIC